MNKETQINSSNFKLKRACRNQYEFRTFCLDDLVPRDHKVRVIWDFISQLDLSACFEEIFSYILEVGRSATDPKIMLALWIYSIIDGNCSARKLEELCEKHDVYKWLCGGVPVNRTTLAEFRSKNPRKFDELLTKCLAVMVKNELITDSDFAQDGTRVKANAGFSSYRTEDSLLKIQTEISDYIKKLQAEEKSSPDAYDKRKIAQAEDKKSRVQEALRNLHAARCEKTVNGKRNNNQVTEEDLKAVRASTTDPEARKMKMGDGGFRLAYNVQFATGLDSMVIFGVDLVNTQDPGTPPRLMHQVQERLKRINLSEIKNWIADSAYSSFNDIINASLLFPNCLYYAPPRKKKEAKIHRSKDCEAVTKWRNMIDSDEVKQIYKKRSSTAEFSNMHVKNCSLKEFFVRGRLKAKGMAVLHAIAFNVARFLDLSKNKK